MASQFSTDDIKTWVDTQGRNASGGLDYNKILAGAGTYGVSSGDLRTALNDFGGFKAGDFQSARRGLVNQGLLTVNQPESGPGFATFGTTQKGRDLISSASGQGNGTYTGLDTHIQAQPAGTFKPTQQETQNAQNAALISYQRGNRGARTNPEPTFQLDPAGFGDAAARNDERQRLREGRNQTDSGFTIPEIKQWGDAHAKDPATGQYDIAKLMMAASSYGVSLRDIGNSFGFTNSEHQKAADDLVAGGYLSSLGQGTGRYAPTSKGRQWMDEQAADDQSSYQGVAEQILNSPYEGILPDAPTTPATTPATTPTGTPTGAPTGTPATTPTGTQAGTQSQSGLLSQADGSGTQSQQLPPPLTEQEALTEAFNAFNAAGGERGNGIGAFRATLNQLGLTTDDARRLRPDLFGVGGQFAAHLDALDEAESSGNYYVDPNAAPNAADKIAEIMNSDNPLLKRAMTKALQIANSRGLLNSSMATEAGAAAVLDQAKQIAAMDLEHDQDIELMGGIQKLVNDAALERATLSENMKKYGYDMAMQGSVMDLLTGLEKSYMNELLAIDQTNWEGVEGDGVDAATAKQNRADYLTSKYQTMKDSITQTIDNLAGKDWGV